MADRRSLIEGMKATPTEAEKAFVFKDASQSVAKAEPAAKTPSAASSAVTRSPLSTRIRSDFAVLLKRASLERQLSGTEPNSISDILDEALEPWLKANGYLL
ncbi:hypothetical protein Pan44_10120 [Caulifigura coniformis]|uniref:Uncharacterized protein n=1 Tax=Caulifigura coniformis TaxID=2527983 RepID=A0A517SA43_9PLAN|nr:hypothetical protein [Caulifigura coniformis]QDT52997.1 hypothetical protein Pan44_10120 [Caulifigura coniformis]